MPHQPAKNTLSILGQLAPLIMLLLQLIYNYGVKTASSDLQLKQESTDHETLMLLKDRFASYDSSQKEMAGKVDTLLRLYQGKSAAPPLGGGPQP